MIGTQQFDGMAETDTLGLHDPIDGRAADVALAHAAPEIGFRRHDQRRRAVVMERAASDLIRPGALQLHPEAVHQALDGDFSFQPLDLFVRDARL